MQYPAILGLNTAVPENKHEQMDLYDRWLSPYINSQRAKAIFSAAEIDTRYSVLPTADFLANEPGTLARNTVYMQTARKLAAQTIIKTLSDANLLATDIDHLIVTSCTGFDTPGLDVILAADLGMRPDTRRSALIGMGCHAGITGLDRAMLEITARPKSRTLLLAVEFGTLHFQHGHSIDNMVADAIFGDGLAAAVLGVSSQKGALPRLINTATYSDYSHQGLMGFHLSDKGFQIRLSTRVPEVLKTLVPDLVTGFLQQNGLTSADINFWGIHPGGAKIINYVEQALNLTPTDLRYSRQVLQHYGNMSSATIFFVLDKIMQQGHPQPDDFALLLSFGPGLTIELGLVQWC